jgi:hypothetical protein
MKLALMECGRKLGTYLRKRQKMQQQAERRDVFARYIGEIARAVNLINGTDTKKLYEALREQALMRTAMADAQLDEEGKTIKKKDDEDLKQDDSIVLVENRVALSTHEQQDAEVLPAEEDEQGRVKLDSPKKKKKSPSKDGELF